VCHLFVDSQDAVFSGGNIHGKTLNFSGHILVSGDGNGKLPHPVCRKSLLVLLSQLLSFYAPNVFFIASLLLTVNHFFILP